MYLYKKLLQDLINYKDLIWYLAKADLKSSTARTYLGLLWWIIDPILYTAIYYLLVQVILHRGGPNYAVFLVTALIPMKFTISSMIGATTAITSMAGVIRQIHVPKIVFITSRMFGLLIKFAISFSVLLLFLFFYGIQLSTTYLMVPVIIIVQVIFSLAIMPILAHIGVYFRDIRNIMQYFTSVLYYLSPVMYAISSVPENLQKYMYFNPLTIIIESYRNILLYQQYPSWLQLGVLLIIALGLLYLGIKLLFRYEREYAKVI